jgi:hypothetical protein
MISTGVRGPLPFAGLARRVIGRGGRPLMEAPTCAGRRTHRAARPAPAGIPASSPASAPGRQGWSMVDTMHVYRP